jgi:hypothetical protein
LGIKKLNIINLRLFNCLTQKSLKVNYLKAFSDVLISQEEIMSKLTVVDLDFLSSEYHSHNKVQGGYQYFNASVAASVHANATASVGVNVYISPSFNAVATYNASASAAGAGAGAASVNGIAYASTSVTVSAS